MCRAAQARGFIARAFQFAFVRRDRERCRHSQRPTSQITGDARYTRLRPAGINLGIISAFEPADDDILNIVFIEEVVCFRDRLREIEFCYLEEPFVRLSVFRGDALLGLMPAPPQNTREPSIGRWMSARPNVTPGYIFTLSPIVVLG